MQKKNHCISCNSTFPSKNHYRHHMEKVHKIIIPRRHKPAGISPDVNDPNNHCKSCNFHYKDRSQCRHHLKFTHKMELPPLKNRLALDPTISTSSALNPNNRSCAICEVTYCSRYNYRQHMKKLHSDGRHAPVSIGRKISMNPNMQPDLRDSSNFCCSCQRTYSRRNSYHTHLRLVHPNLENTTRRSINLIRMKMDTGDPSNKRCTICERDFDNRLFLFNTHEFST